VLFELQSGGLAAACNPDEVHQMGDSYQFAVDVRGYAKLSGSWAFDGIIVSKQFRFLVRRYCIVHIEF